MTVIDALYLEKIAQIRSASRRLAYRGQSDSAWPIRSGATRRLLHHVTESHSKDYESTVPFGKLYAAYHQNTLLEPARTYGFDSSEGQIDSDLQLLAQLQHFGAATGLIDFTWDSLVALWFASSMPHDCQCSGKIFVIDLNDTTQFVKVSHSRNDQTLHGIFPLNTGPTTRQLYWEPVFRGDAANRVLRQRSVFVAGHPTEREVPQCRILLEIYIPFSEKENIRKELDALFGISEQSLFPDVHGYSTANSVSSPIPPTGNPEVFLFKGSDLYQRGEYGRAIDAYDECLRLEPTQPIAYFLRGNARAQTQDYTGAKGDYDVALQQFGRLSANTDPSRTTIHAHYRELAAFNRGNMNYMLGDYQAAIEDYSEAIKHSTPTERGVMYFNRANNKVKLENYSDALEDYDAANCTNIRYSAFNKGNTLLVLGRFEEALECYKSEAVKQGNDEGVYEGVANNIANLNQLIGRVSDGIPIVKGSKDDTSRHKGGVNIEVRGNDKAKREMPSLYPHHKGEITFLVSGSAGNVGNFGGGDTSGGEGFMGENPIFLNFMW